MSSTRATVDPRQRYRVEFDLALQRGEVDDRLIAEGGCVPWNRYMRAAELCERPPEEWELERVSDAPPGYHGYAPWQREAHDQLHAQGTAFVSRGRGEGKTFFACRELFDGARYTPGGRFVLVSHTRAHAEAAWALLLRFADEERMEVRLSRRHAWELGFANGAAIRVELGDRPRDASLRGPRLDGVALDERQGIHADVEADADAATGYGAHGWRLVVEGERAGLSRSEATELVRRAHYLLGLREADGAPHQAHRFIEMWPTRNPFPPTPLQVAAYIATLMALPDSATWGARATEERYRLWQDHLLGPTGPRDRLGPGHGFDVG